MLIIAKRGLGLQSLRGVRPLDVVLWGSAITLMWASVEKWAYPNWNYPVLAAHPNLTDGLDPKFFMLAAGLVEFSLAFALLWTPMVRRVAAILLASMFVSAVLEFGKIDAIGHLLIIVLLLAIAADDQASCRSKPSFAPLWYSVAHLPRDAHGLLRGARAHLFHSRHLGWVDGPAAND